MSIKIRDGSTLILRTQTTISSRTVRTRIRNLFAQFFEPLNLKKINTFENLNILRLKKKNI